MLTEEQKAIIEEKEQQIEELEEKVNTLQEEVALIKENNCEHDWGQWERVCGHDDEYRDCRVCGKTEWR